MSTIFALLLIAVVSCLLTTAIKKERENSGRTGLQKTQCLVKLDNADFNFFKFILNRTQDLVTKDSMESTFFELHNMCQYTPC